MHNYVISNSTPLHPALKKLQEATFANEKTAPVQGMISPLDSASLLQTIAALVGAKKAIDIGVFTGFTSLSMALAMPAEGKVYALDVSSEYAAVGQPFWAEAGQADKIELRVAPAQESLRALIAEGHGGTFDIVFIDADKTGYPEYYELSLELLRSGGVILIDNVFMGGSVIDPNSVRPGTIAVRGLNAKIAKDSRVTVTMLPVSDGISLIRKL